MSILGGQIVFIGAGNVGTHLAQACKQADFTIKAIYSRTMNSAQILADKMNCIACCDIAGIPEADIFIYCIKDDALPQTAAINSLRFPNALHVHTSGSTPANVFQNNRYGVIYPMQTFSKNAEVDFSKVRCFIEGNNAKSLECIRFLAESISQKVSELDTNARLSLHAAAVFACNFSNHCFTLAGEILKEKAGLPFETLLPLIDETIRKVHFMPPEAAQTGPAVRFDRNIINKHLEMLRSHPLQQEIYRLVSQSIHETATRPEKER